LSICYALAFRASYIRFYCENIANGSGDDTFFLPLPPKFSIQSGFPLDDEIHYRKGKRGTHDRCTLPSMLCGERKAGRDDHGLPDYDEMREPFLGILNYMEAGRMTLNADGSVIYNWPTAFRACPPR